MKKHPYIRKTLFLLIAAVIAGLLWANIFTGPGITQNTDTILTNDLNGQYISYLMYFRNAVLSGKNLSYSFSSLLGNGTAGLIGYYLMSPLNLLVLLFPADQIARAVYWIILLKVSLAGMSAAWFFGRKRNDSWKALIFSTTYALSGYTCAYFIHLMWMDTVVLLPVAAIGIEKLVHEKKTVFYAVSLGLTLVICYYTGYMAAGFCLLYFLFLLMEKKRSGKEKAGLILRYLTGTALGGMLAGFTLVPVLMAQASSNMGIQNAQSVNLSFGKMLSGLFTGNASMNGFRNGSPHLYVGMFMLFLVILYLIPQKKEQRREVFWADVILILFAASMMVGKLDLIWHLFSQPHGFPYRYVFGVILFLLILAERGLYERVPDMRIRDAASADGVIILMAGTVWMTCRKTCIFQWILADVLWTVILSVVLYSMRNHKAQWKRSALMALSFGQVIMLSLNGFAWACIHSYDDHSLEGYYRKYAAVISDTAGEDDDFYRMEKNFSHSENDAYLFSYPGLSFFSSADRESSRQLMEKLGYNVNYMWAGYGSGGGIAGDSFFALRYFLSDHALDDPLAELHVHQDNVYVYENPYAFPLGFATGKEIRHVKSGKSVFENQEKLYSGILGRNISFYKFQNEQDAEIRYAGVKETVDDIYGHKLKKEGKEGSVQYVFQMKTDGPAYLYLYDTDLSGVFVSVNGSEGISYGTAENHGILPLGTFHAGDQVKVALSPRKDRFVFSRMEVADMDLSSFSDAVSEIRLSGWKETGHTENAVHADMEMREGGMILTTIPYDTGWQIKVDGKKIRGEESLNALLSFPVKKGKHHIDLIYEAPGRKAGIGMSASAAVILLICVKIERRRGRHE